jgi:hypothetical protein
MSVSFIFRGGVCVVRGRFLFYIFFRGGRGLRRKNPAVEVKH